MVDAVNPNPISDPSSDLSKIDPLSSNADNKKAPGTNFQQFMNRPSFASQTSASFAPNGPTPAELANSGRNVMAPGVANEQTVTTVLNQTNQTAKQVQAKLMQNSSQLTNAQQLQLKQKLTNAVNNIKQAATKAGIDPDQFQAKPMGGPFGKLMSMLSQGQQMLNSARNQVPQLAKAGQLNPGDFFAMQLKLSVAQIDLEFSSQLLGKSSDALNKLMNINI
jgi:hypothetical protein